MSMKNDPWDCKCGASKPTPGLPWECQNCGGTIKRKG